MITQTELTEFFDASASTFDFLSKALLKELNEEAIANLASADFPEQTGNEHLDEGYRLIRRYFHFSNADRRTQLAVEYARIFLAAGVYTRQTRTAVPYESVYTSEEHIVMQESRDDCVRRYLADGFKVNPDLHEPEDHISFELEYLSDMCSKAGEIARAKDSKALAANVQHQVEFIEQHVLNWVPTMLEVAKNFAKTTFYLGLLEVVIGTAEQARDMLLAIQEQMANGGKEAAEADGEAEATETGDEAGVAEAVEAVDAAVDTVGATDDADVTETANATETPADEVDASAGSNAAEE